MLPALQKTAFFFSFFLLALQPAKAMEPDIKDLTIGQAKVINPIYWNEFTAPQKEVVFQYNSLRLNVKSKLEDMESQAFSAHFCEEFFRKFEFDNGENLLLDIVEGATVSLEKALFEARFPDDRTAHISGILQQTKRELTTMLTPIQDAFNALKRKETPVKELETTPFRVHISETIDDVSAYFPSDTKGIKEHFFPDIQEKRPLNPETLIILEGIEKDMDERRGLSHSETVMAYGKILAPKFWPDLIKTLPGLITLPQKRVDLNEIGPWLKTFKLLEGLKHAQIARALESIQATSENFTMATGLKPQEVWKLTYHLVRTIYEKRDDDNAKNLLLTYGMKLEEQNIFCPAGGIGRNFQVLTQGYKLLIEQQNR